MISNNAGDQIARAARDAGLDLSSERRGRSRDTSPEA
jgi:hypothetical protein